MKDGKFFLRKKFIKARKKKYLNIKSLSFNFNLIFNLIKKHFGKRKIFIAGYYPVNHEVNILSFMEKAFIKKNKISLPVIENFYKMSFKLWNFKEPLAINKFGILEPKKVNKKIKPDLIMVPLVAFDSNLNRIGYGKGYYDRYLNKNRKSKNNPVSIGVAYSFQRCRKIPFNKYDHKLDYIFTEQGIISSK